MDEVVPVKRGRGRPPGSRNLPRAPLHTPEEIEALKRVLAGRYAEAVASHAVTTERKRRVLTEIKTNFGRRGLAVIAEKIDEAEALLAEGLAEGAKANASLSA